MGQACDADCEAFNTSGGDVSFDGSLGRNADLSSFSVPADAGLQKVFKADGTSVDLKVAAYLLYGFTGSWKVGTGDPAPNGSGGDDGGGCAVSGPLQSPAPFVLVGLLVLWRRRMR